MENIFHTFTLQLIDYEPRAQLQVPLLLRLGVEQAALNKAVESGNTDLVYMVILHLQNNMPLANFEVSEQKRQKKNLISYRTYG